MIDFEIAQRLVRMQERLRSATWHMIRQDGHCKSGEGEVTLSFIMPPVVGDDRTPFWRVQVYSYLLCPDARSEIWDGKTALEAISKAEDAVRVWCMGAEMEMFEQGMEG